MPRREILGLVFLAMGSFVAACGGGNSQGGQAASSCPSIPPQLSALSAADRSIPVSPAGAQLCSFSKRRLLPFEPAKGVKVDRSTAGMIVSLINAAAAFKQPTRTCHELKADNGVMIRFSYSRSRSYQVTLIYYGCPTPVVFGLSQPRAPTQAISDLVVSAANSFASKPGTPTAPELIGDDIATAEHIAAAAGYALGYGGEQLSSGLPFGSVLFQIPPAGLLATNANQIDVTIAVQPEPACGADSLAGEYQGGGLQSAADYGHIVIWNTGSTWCTLQGPISITGVNGSGAPVTNTANSPVAPNVVLTPHTPPPPNSMGGFGPVAELWASVQVSAQIEDPVTGQPCNRQITPSSWEITSDGDTFSIKNTSVDVGSQISSLVTCSSVGAQSFPVSAF